MDNQTDTTSQKMISADEIESQGVAERKQVFQIPLG